jgi:hypothetical protein
MWTNKTLQLLANNLNVNRGSIFLHFTESIPSVEEINAYMEMGLSRVMWVQPYSHLQKEMYEATVVYGLPSQHICLPHWVLDGIDDVFTSQRVYIELEKIENVSLIDVKSAESISNILARMTKTIDKEKQIKNLIIREANVDRNVQTILSKYSFYPSMQISDMVVYSRLE